MKIEFEITKESTFISKLTTLKRIKLISLIAQRGQIYFSIVYFLGFMMLNMPFTSYENLENTLGPTGIWVLDKGIFLLISILLGFGTHRLARKMTLSSYREQINKLPKYIFGKRQVNLDEDGISIFDPKYSCNYSWYVLEEVIEDDTYLLVKALGQIILLVPKSAFIDSNEKNQFIDLFRKSQPDELRIWLEEDKKLSKQKNLEKKSKLVLLSSILSFIFSIFLIGLVFSFFTLRYINNFKKLIDESGTDFEKYKRKIQIAKFIAVIPLVFWSAILLLYLIIFAVLIFG